MSNAKARYRRRRRATSEHVNACHRAVTSVAMLHASRQCRAHAARYDGHQWSLANGVLAVQVRGTKRGTLETVSITGVLVV